MKRIFGSIIDWIILAALVFGSVYVAVLLIRPLCQPEPWVELVNGRPWWKEVAGFVIYMAFVATFLVFPIMGLWVIAGSLKRLGTWLK